MMLALTFLLVSVTSGELVDWLINDVKIPAQVNEIENGQLLKLSNGIVTRTFLIRCVVRKYELLNQPLVYRQKIKIFQTPLFLSLLA